MEARTVIGVCGSGAELDPATATTAYEVGRGLAEAGAVVVTGGRGGVMAEASRGAVEAGGTTVGLLPGDRDEANAWVQVPLATGLGLHRNSVLVRSVQGIVAVDGAYGTLSEVAAALNFGRPVVAVGSWTLVRPDGTGDDGIVVAATAADAVAAVLALTRS